VPARRNFLKSNPVETRHILEEFYRVALAFPEIAFSLINNGEEVHRLMASTFKQRIVSLFGNSWNEKLLMVKEEHTSVKVTGFIGKPDAAKKTGASSKLLQTQSEVIKMMKSLNMEFPL
jgi:DNA mismatch repair protein MutL